MIVSAVKKSNKELVKKFAKQRKAHEEKSHGHDDSDSGEDLTSMIARCFMAPMADTTSSGPAICGLIVLSANCTT
jgi:hypothetical protein